MSNGPVAQMGERSVRIREVEGSNPFRSTIFYFKTICRCDGIGRRTGFKIQRWRHRAGSTPATGTIVREPLFFKGSRIFFVPGNGSQQAAFYAEIALRSGREVTADRKRRGDIGIVIQMRVNIGCCSDIAVTEPLLDLFHGYAVCVKHAGVGMPEIVKTDRP